MIKESIKKQLGLNTQVESPNVLEYSKQLFVRCFEDEFSRLPTDEVMVLMPWLVKSCTTIKLHTLFSKDNLVKVTEEIFTSPVVRDFCLCLADRFYIDLSGEKGHQEILIEMLSNVCHITGGNNSLVPARIMATLQTLVEKKEDIKNLLNDNSWLVVIVMLFITYRIVLQSAIVIHPKLVPAIKRESNN